MSTSKIIEFLGDTSVRPSWRGGEYVRPEYINFSKLLHHSLLQYDYDQQRSEYVHDIRIITYGENRLRELFE